ncbi:MAG: FG-GAP repeat domain-containing protein [Candidatus Helarchaeota archaeon]
MNKKRMSQILGIMIIISFNLFISSLSSIYFNVKSPQTDVQNTAISLNTALYSWDSQLTRGVGTEPLAIAIGDVNNDGALDMVTANNDSNTITILLWNMTIGDWGNQEKSVGTAPSDIAIGDANNDGFADIVVSNNLSNDITILLWNNSLQTWNSSTRGVGNHPSSVAIGDANNDGLNEIIVTNFEDDSISIFVWNSSHSDWNTKLQRSVGNGPISVVVGDANYDGLLDIITADELGSTVSILEWDNLIKNWSAVIPKMVGNTPSDLVVGDANNDGAVEIYTSNRVDATVSILAWNITISDWDLYVKSVGNSPSSITVGDVNYDGQEDIVVTNYADANISLLMWDISIKNWTPSTEPVGQGPTSVAIGDVNNDGVLEVVVTNGIANNISILLWNTTPGDISPRMPLNVDGYCLDIAVGDANNDGEMDLVAATPNDNNISLLSWNALLNDWDSETEIAAGIHPTTVSIGDANNDGAEDIVAASTIDFSNVSIVTWNKNTHSWNPFIQRNVTLYGIKDIEVADVNNDGANDIVVVNRDQVRIEILLWNKTSTDWDPVITLYPTSIPETLGVGDVNNDGYNDIVAAGNNTNTVYVFSFLWNFSDNDWMSCNALTVCKSQPIFTPAIAIGDADNNGLNNLVITDQNRNNVSILSWNNTLQRWNPAMYQPVQPGPTSVAIGDANNDGWNDIVTSNIGTDRVTVLYWNSMDGTWDPQIAHDGGVDPYSIMIADVNNNGESDILVANPTSSQISILLFNHYPSIITPSIIQNNPLWVQDEDFGAFSINLTVFETDIDDAPDHLYWFTSGLNTSLVTVSNELAPDNILIFHSVANMSGTDIFEIRLQDSHYFQVSVVITLQVNPVNDDPVILFKDLLEQNSIWHQTPGVNSFSINLSQYEFDLEDQKNELNWFVVGLDPGLATVQGENTSQDILTFQINGRGSDEFYLVLIDSEGATDNVTITLNVNPSGITFIIRLFIIIGSIIVAVVISILLFRNWKKRQSSGKPTEKNL